MKRFAFAATGAALMLAAMAMPAAAMDDATFLQTAIGVNLAEIQMGQLAQANSQNADVKAYGQLLVTDHTASNQKATQLAQADNIQPPTAPSAPDQQMFAQLKGLTGTDFDRMFLKDMVVGHTNALAMFKAKANEGTNNDIGTFAQNTLPTLQQHLDKANQLLQSTGAGTAPNATSGTTNDNGAPATTDTSAMPSATDTTMAPGAASTTTAQ